MTAIAPIQSRKMPPVDFTGMLEVAKQLVGTGFLPEHIKTPGQCVAIILAGQELGMSPMMALRSIVMVKGKIVVSADAQLALFKSSGGRAVFRILSDKGATLWLQHPNGDEHTESFTAEDAKRAGLLGNATWTKFPKAMFRSRVITAGLKSVGFEPTAGAYDPDEMQHVTTEPLPQLAAVTEEAEAVEEVTAEPEPERTVEWARAFVIPFPGTLEGQKLGVCGIRQLVAFIEWADGKIADAGDDAPELLTSFREACSLLLEAKSASTSVKVPAPGKVEDAIEPDVAVQGPWEDEGWKTLPQNVLAEDPANPLPF